jgi:hypothetical protein
MFLQLRKKVGLTSLRSSHGKGIFGRNDATRSTSSVGRSVINVLVNDTPAKEVDNPSFAEMREESPEDMVEWKREGLYTCAKRQCAETRRYLEHRETCRELRKFHCTRQRWI